MSDSFPYASPEYRLIFHREFFFLYYAEDVLWFHCEVCGEDFRYKLTPGMWTVDHHLICPQCETDHRTMEGFSNFVLISQGRSPEYPVPDEFV